VSVSPFGQRELLSAVREPHHQESWPPAPGSNVSIKNNTKQENDQVNKKHLFSLLQPSSLLGSPPAPAPIQLSGRLRVAVPKLRQLEFLPETRVPAPGSSDLLPNIALGVCVPLCYFF
jgi:hypothetical protein